MRSVPKLGVVVVLLGAIGGWFYYTPYLAVKTMREAAEKKDSVTLSRYINFPAVRESLKANFNAAMLSEMKKDRGKNPYAAAGAVFAMALIGPMVDAMVTPEALAVMMKGEKPSLENKSATTSLTASEPEVDTRMGYESFDQFLVSAKKKGASDEPITMVFQREGLMSWKLTAIRLPL